MRALSTDIFEDLFFLYMGIALAVGALVLGWLFYSMWKYRARPEMPLPHDAPKPGVIPAERGHVIWVYVMAGGIAVIMFGLAFGTISATDTLEHPPADEPAIHINVTGFQFGWRFNHTGQGGVPFSKIGSLTLPVHVNVVANVTSQDVWHNFAIPDYRMRIDAIPGEVTHMWFKPQEIGEGHTVCVHLCGVNHAGMRAQLHVVTQAEYDAFIAAESTKAYEALAKRGAVANVTLLPEGNELVQVNATAKQGPIALRIQNDDIAERVVSARGHSVRVAPGAAAWLYTTLEDVQHGPAFEVS